MATASKYTFDTRRNAYFRGSDLRVTETATGHTIIVNGKDGYLAVHVKDETIARDYPADVIAASERIGTQRAEGIYQGVQADFWRWAEEMAGAYKLDGIGQAGRSGGWLTVDGTQHFDAETLIDPTEGEEGDADLRERFLAFAFEVDKAIESEFRPRFYEQVKAAAAEMPNDVNQYVVQLPATNVAATSPAEAVLTILDEVLGETGMVIVRDRNGERVEWTAPPEPVIRIIFGEEDARGMAKAAGVSEEVAVERAREWGKYIGDTATALCNEQLEDAIRTGSV